MQLIQKFTCLVILSFASLNVFSQTATTKLPHIKVVLVGTFHFGNTPDKGKIAFDDLFSSKRQQELQRFTTQLAQLKPDKVFVESEPDQQMHWDSLFSLYQTGKRLCAMKYFK